MGDEVRSRYFLARQSLQQLSRSHSDNHSNSFQFADGCPYRDRQSESRSHFGGPLGTLEPQPERAKSSFSPVAAINLFTLSLSDAAKTNPMAWALHALTSAASSRGLSGNPVA